MIKQEMRGFMWLMCCRSWLVDSWPFHLWWPMKLHRTNLGLRQGGILSTHLYKSYINKLLKMFEKSGLVTIGSLYLRTPTYANDILLIANNSFQSQAMLDLSVNYSVENEYSVHPVKSTVTPYIKHKQESATHAHTITWGTSQWTLHNHSLISDRSGLRVERHQTSTCGSSCLGTLAMHY